MKIKRYENLILEIEKLAKNPEENAEKLKELTGILADQQAYFETVSVKKIGEKINSGSLSAKQYMILKSLLVEKKFYEKNSKKIDAVIAGDYKIFNKTKKVTFRRIIKATGVIAAAALLTLGLSTCNKKQKRHDDKVKNDVVTEETEETTEITEDNNKDKVSDITTEAVKEKDNAKETTEENIEAKESSKDNIENKKDSKKDEKTTETKEEENKNNDVTVNNNTGKPETTTTTTQNTASSSTSNSYSNRETSTIVPVKPENVQTNGKLPIEPTTIVVDNTSNEPVNNDNKVIPADKPVPSTNNVDANTKDETTSNIPSNSSTEPAYNGKDEHKTDSYSEEKPSDDPSFQPTDNNTVDTWSDSEITHDIPDNSSHEPAYNGEEEDKPNNILNIIDAPTNIPTLDNNHIKDDGTEFIINNINFINTIENFETPSYSNDTPSFDNVEDDGTEIIINDYSNGNNVISLEDDNKVDSYSEETIGSIPSFDNVEEDETMDVDVKGYTYTLSFPGMTL